MTIHVYETSGHLTGIIESENFIAAQAYLTYDHTGKPLNMEQYLDQPLRDAVEMLEWQLDGNGCDYKVRAITKRALTHDELDKLSSEVSGQNSDGLGEGFEQQAFAERHDGECGECSGCEYGDGCEDDDYAGMISFDWQTNKLPWTKVR